MQEWPDAEVYRRALEKTGLGRRIARVDLREPEQLRRADPDELNAALKGRTLTEGRRHGKILFSQAGIAPETRADALPRARLADLREIMRRVLQAAAEAQADPARMPDDWLTPHRGEDADRSCCGTRLQRRKVGGRTARVCPRCQPAA